jgi:glutamate dehydrogenase
VVRAYTLGREIFELEPLWDRIDALDYQVPTALQLDLLGKLISISQRASRWILRLSSKEADLPSVIQRYHPGASELRSNLEHWLPGAARADWQQATQKLAAAGVERELAQSLSALEFIFPALDLVDLAQSANTDLEKAARAYFGVDAELGLSAWRAEINRLPTDTLWQTQARGSARDDVYSIARQITHGLLTRGENVQAWAAQHRADIERLRRLLQDISMQSADLAPVSVALRELRHLG